MELSFWIIFFVVVVVLAGTAYWLIMLITTPYLEKKNRMVFGVALVFTCCIGIGGVVGLTSVF